MGVGLGTSALLVLEDGSIFPGLSIGVEGQTVGEVVFNTAITGYQEILTDPSYAGQIVTLTYPHIGNVGINADDQESNKVWVAGLIIRDLSLVASNWRSQQPLSDYLKANNIVAIAEVDTRQLTRLLRDKGALRGCIVASHAAIDAEQALQAARAFPSMQNLDLAKTVSTQETYIWQETSWNVTASPAKYHVVAYDFGVKHNILRMLVDRGCKVTVVPAQTSAEAVLALQPDGIFLSNGPGDPAPCDYAIKAIQKILTTDIPVFGICLGHQLLALACGAKTLKMKFGHHGANHPVQDLNSQQVFITSQNHGFAVDENTLPKELKATHRSLFDGSLQGIAHTQKPAFSFQGHPEASPGPHDVGGLFDHFIKLIDNYTQSISKCGEAQVQPRSGVYT
jgi:carbamoyl-phosphate synthase small subunit